ncbi:MAG: hypothetical protein ACMUIA_06615 [bacterium]
MKKGTFSLFQIFLIAFFSILIAITKVYLKFSLKIPGHSALFLITLLIIIRGLVPRKGTALIAGALGGLLAAGISLSARGPLDTFLCYTAAGFGVEIAALAFKNLEYFPFAAIAGLLGNMIKLGAKITLDFSLGTPLPLILAGRTYSFFTYLIFGIISGLLGALTLKALRKAGLFVYLAEKQ